MSTTMLAAGAEGHEAAQALAPARRLPEWRNLPEKRWERQLQVTGPSDLAAEGAERIKDRNMHDDRAMADKRQSLGGPLPGGSVAQARHLARHGLHHFGWLCCRHVPPLSSW